MWAFGSQSALIEDLSIDLWVGRYLIPRRDRAKPCGVRLFRKEEAIPLNLQHRYLAAEFYVRGVFVVVGHSRVVVDVAIESARWSCRAA